MVTVSLRDLDLVEEWGRSDPTLRLRADFPLFAGHGASSSAVVVFELGEGEHVGLHTDSAEEVVLVLDGRAKAEERFSASRVAHPEPLTHFDEQQSE